MINCIIFHSWLGKCTVYTEHTMGTFWQHTKASLGELVPLEILGKHQYDFKSRNLIIIYGWPLWEPIMVTYLCNKLDLERKVRWNKCDPFYTYIFSYMKNLMEYMRCFLSLFVNEAICIKSVTFGPSQKSESLLWLTCPPSPEYF